MFANHGALVKHNHLMEGINSRLDGLQAAILSVKLKYILDWTALRIEKAAYYDTLLADIKQIQLPKVRPNTKHSYHLYVILAEDRDALRAYLAEQGIPAEVHYPVPLPFMLAYQYLGLTRGQFPICDHNQAKLLSIPIYPEITTEQMDYIGQKIRQFYV
jgi:dTDP-4-amino-4,6-dideoxygalactose transaminase